MGDQVPSCAGHSCHADGLSQRHRSAASVKRVDCRGLALVPRRIQVARPRNAGTISPIVLSVSGCRATPPRSHG
eukprot:scaffold770_cov255-Pinguiococcus_pyrenoidosus.AAC.62